eukprot:TRINITY_DN477_c0_g1_i2.p1 TRINITY_DN477_c0_g1~~TRINITY_DN477_c0_g1_i2.p1  ORF type:complete len:242 (-),score=52.63 TRINITY_DN477_c0_g1_i2:60-785(-)
MLFVNCSLLVITIMKNLTQLAAELFNQIEQLYDPISGYCTEDTCPTMSAGARFQYLWAEGEHRGKPVSLCAREYIINLALWSEDLIFDESIFPEDDSEPSKNFRSVTDKIWRRLIRVLYHIYHHHIDEIKSLSLQDQLVQLTRFYCLFSLEYDLIRDPAQYEPISKLLDQIVPERWREILKEKRAARSINKGTTRRRKRPQVHTTRAIKLDQVFVENNNSRPEPQSVVEGNDAGDIEEIEN